MDLFQRILTPIMSMSAKRCKDLQGEVRQPQTTQRGKGKNKLQADSSHKICGLLRFIHDQMTRCCHHCYGHPNIESVPLHACNRSCKNQGVNVLCNHCFFYLSFLYGLERRNRIVWQIRGRIFVIGRKKLAFLQEYSICLC